MAKASITEFSEAYGVTADDAYLKGLIENVNELRRGATFRLLDLNTCDFSYMPTKKTSYIGLKQGYSACLSRQEKGMKETDKLRSTTKDYLRFIRNRVGALVQVETYDKGRLDCLFQVQWVNTTRYLFPFSEKGGFYPTYVYAAEYEENRVVEEYMVEGNQIVYEAYSPVSDRQTAYYFINYVPSGKYPVREMRKGKFRFDPLRFEETYYDSWLKHREL